MTRHRRAMTALATGTLMMVVAVPAAVASQHPGLWRDEPRPVRKRGNEAEVLANVLLADQTDWNSTAVGIDDGRAEQGFEHENALGVMPQRAVPGVGEDGLRLVEPLGAAGSRRRRRPISEPRTKRDNSNAPFAFS